MSDIDITQKLDLLLKDERQLDVTEIDTAIRVIESLHDVDFRSWYLARLAKKSADIKLWDKAVKLAQSATRFYDRSDALVSVAEGIIKEQGISAAVKMINDTVVAVGEVEGDEVWPWQRADILNRIAILFQRNGDNNSALRVWTSAVQIAQAGQSHDTDSSSVLVEIAKELSLAGYSTFAKSVAYSVQISSKREFALKQIASQNV